MKKYPDGWPNHDGKYKCAECDQLFPPEGVDVDHIVPKKAGGINCLKNLQPLCVHCNRSKQAQYSVKDRIKAKLPPGWRKLYNRHF